MLTSGTLGATQELLASYLAGDKDKNGHYLTSRVPKMAAYGGLISAPLGHVLISILQRVFAGQSSLRARVLQILASNLIVGPTMRTSCNEYLTCFRLLLYRTQCISLPWPS